MKFLFPTIATFAVLGFVSIGCDKLPEAFSGKAAPDAKAIHAVGPSGEYASEHVTGNAIEASDPKFKTIDGSGTQSNSTPRVQPIAYQTSDGQGSGVDSTTSTLLPPESVPPETMPSAADRPRRTDGIIVVEYAQLKFLNDIEVAAPADGFITKLDLQEGDSVAKGDILVELDKRLVEAELEVARNEAIAAIKKSEDKSEIEYAKSAEEVAKQDLDNSTELMSRRVESQGDHRKKWLEHRRSELAITVADLKRSQDIAAADVTRAKERKAETQIDLLTVKANFPGMIATKNKDVYEWVRAGEILMRLVSLEKLRVLGRVRVDSLDAAPHLLVGAPAKITIQLYPGAREVVSGKVGFVSPVMDSAGNYVVWVEIPNQLVKDQWLFREGMIATIEIDTKH